MLEDGDPRQRVGDERGSGRGHERSAYVPRRPHQPATAPATAIAPRAMAVAPALLPPGTRQSAQPTTTARTPVGPTTAPANPTRVQATTVVSMAMAAATAHQSQAAAG